MLASLQSSAAGLQRQFMALLACCFFVPPALLLISIGLAEWLNQLYGSPIGWISASVCLCLSLVIALVAIYLSRKEPTTATAVRSNPAQLADQGANANLSIEDLQELAFALKGPVEQEIRQHPFTSLSLCVGLGIVLATQPDLIRKLADNLDL
jgi:hypothetical protein